MGGDGGVKAIQKRFMRGYKDPNKRDDSKNIKEQQRMKTKLCAISCKPLSEPVVACELGNVYNKEEILTSLINKTLNPSFAHIRGLKDLKTLKFTRNSLYDATTESSSTENSNHSQFVCPVSGDEFNGMLPFAFIWTTGFVLSERAIREMGAEALQSEFGPFGSADIIRLNPSEEELPLLRSQMETRRAERNSKKPSKRKHEKSAGEEGAEVEIGRDGDSIAVIHSSEKSAKQLKSAASNITSSSSSSSSSSGPSALNSSSSGLVRSASEKVGHQSEHSRAFRSLFHTDEEAAKNTRDLFMSVAGLRYTLS